MYYSQRYLRQSHVINVEISLALRTFWRESLRIWFAHNSLLVGFAKLSSWSITVNNYKWKNFFGWSVRSSNYCWFPSMVAGKVLKYIKEFIWFLLVIICKSLDPKLIWVISLFRLTLPTYALYSKFAKRRTQSLTPTKMVSLFTDHPLIDWGHFVWWFAPMINNIKLSLGEFADHVRS